MDRVSSLPTARLSGKRAELNDAMTLICGRRKRSGFMRRYGHICQGAMKGH